MIRKSVVIGTLAAVLLALGCEGFNRGFCDGYKNGCVKRCPPGQAAAECQKACDDKLSTDTVYQSKCVKK